MRAAAHSPRVDARKGSLTRAGVELAGSSVSVREQVNSSSQDWAGHLPSSIARERQRSAQSTYSSEPQRTVAKGGHPAFGNRASRPDDRRRLPSGRLKSASAGPSG